MSTFRNRFFLLLGLTLMIGALYMALIWAPEERTMGVVQRIFYFHVASAWTAMLAFTAVFFASLAYLLRRKIYWDYLAEVSAETGLLFCTVVLITGPIWAKPVWGIWWTWDARLTLTLVMWLTYGAYLMLRHQIGDEARRAKVSAPIGIMAYLNIPLVYFSIRWWRTQHPAPVLAGGESSGLDPRMYLTLLIAFAAVLWLAILMIRLRFLENKCRNELQYCRFLMQQQKNQT